MKETYYAMLKHQIPSLYNLVKERKKIEEMFYLMMHSTHF